MSLVRLTRENMEENFLQYLETVFGFPEVLSATVKGVEITRETISTSGKQAFEAGFHDVFSDIDMTVKVQLPGDGSVTAESYLQRIDRFGVTTDTALGWMFVPEKNVFRIVFKNGMRYDLHFEFEYKDAASVVMTPAEKEEDNPDWPVENINRFWFIQVQALTKLYRRDYLIGAHLANMNCNDTLVMQMIMRDKKYSTNHHRYGYSEALEYTAALGEMPYKTPDTTFARIADHLYSAALAYDRLVGYFYPDYRARSDEFFAIWDCYDGTNLEIWDLYDRDGNRTGEKFVRGFGNFKNIKEGRYHLIVDLLVLHTDGTYLLTKRSDVKDVYPGYWEASAGGSALSGEEPLDAATRELYEETGLKADSLELTGISYSDKSHGMYYSYIAYVSGDKDRIVLQEGETTDYKWVDREGLLEYVDSDEAMTAHNNRYASYINALRNR